MQMQWKAGAMVQTLWPSLDYRNLCLSRNGINFSKIRNSISLNSHCSNINQVISNLYPRLKKITHMCHGSGFASNRNVFFKKKKYLIVFFFLAPIGKVDVWMDCGISSKASDCILTWRVCKNTQATRRQWTENKSMVTFHINCSLSITQKLPISQTCGVILGYEIRLTQSDTTTELVNLSTSMNQLECDENKCRFTSSIKDTTSVSLAAYNGHGATTPAYLHKSFTGIKKPSHDSLLELKDYSFSLKYHNNYGCLLYFFQCCLFVLLYLTLPR